MKMEFKDCVLFVSDGECPFCDKAKEIISNNGFDNLVQVCSVTDIAEHPQRDEIMMEVQFNNGALPACIVMPKNADEKAVVLCGSKLIRYLVNYSKFKTVKGEAVK